MGIDCPTKVSAVTAWSNLEYCRIAERMPTGIAISSVTTQATAIRLRVFGSRSRISSPTGRFEVTAIPRSPCSTRPSHLPYWTWKRVVQPKLLLERRQVLGVHVAAAHVGAGRPARRRMQQGEDRHADEQQQRDRPDHPAKRVRAHERLR